MITAYWALAAALAQGSAPAAAQDRPTASAAAPAPAGDCRGDATCEMRERGVRTIQEALARLPGKPATNPRVDLVSLFSTDDYPPEAMRRAEQGMTAVELGVSPTGQVVSCRVTASSGSSSLDGRTCAVIMERAHYSILRGRGGHPVASTDRARIRWVLPKQEPLAVADEWSEAVAFIKDHKVVGCKFRGEPSIGSASAAPCRVVMPLAMRIAASAPSDPMKSGMRMSFRSEQLVGETIAPVPAKPFVRRGARRLSIDANGKVVSCADMPEASIGVSDGASCLLEALTFEPLPPSVTNRADRHLIRVQTMTIEPWDGQESTMTAP